MAFNQIGRSENNSTIHEILNKRTFYIAQPIMRFSGYLIIAFVGYLHLFFDALGADDLIVAAWAGVHLIYVVFLELAKKFLAEQYDTLPFRLLRILINLLSFTWLLTISQSADHILVFTFVLPLVVSAVYFRKTPWVLVITFVLVLFGILTGSFFLGGTDPLSLFQIFILVLVMAVLTLGTLLIYNSPPSAYGDLSEIVSDLHDILDLKRLLEELAKLSQHLTGAKHIVVFVINPNTGEYILHTLQNLWLQDDLPITGFIQACLEGMKVRSTININDLDGENELYDRYFRCPAKSVIEVSFASREQQTLGVICLVSDSARTFDPAKRAKIIRFSRLVGSAVENCITYRTAKLSEAHNAPMCKAIGEVENELNLVQAIIAETKRRVPKTQEVVVHRYEPSTERLLFLNDLDDGTLLPWATTYGERRELGKSVMRLGTGLAGMALKLNQPLLAYDVREHPWFLQSKQPIQFRSMLCVPIISSGSGNLYGTISIHNQYRGAYTQQDEIELVALASNAASKLDEISRYNSWREQGGQFKKIFDEVRRFDIQASEDVLWEQIVKAAVSALPFGIARLRLLNPLTNELENTACASRDGRDWGEQTLSPIPLDVLTPFLKDEYMAARAYLIPNDDAAWREVAEKYFYIPAELNEKKTGWLSHDALLVPLRSQSDRWVGLLTLDVPGDGKKPTTEVLEEVSIFGGAIAWAIDLAKTHSQIDINQQRTMELIKSVSEKLGRLKDIRAIGEMAVQVGANIFRAEGCSFHLVDATGRWIELTNSNYLAETAQINRKKPISLNSKCGLTSYVAATGQKIFYPDEGFKLHLAWAGDSDHIPFLNSGKVKSLILMPVPSTTGETLGVLTLENKFIDSGEIVPLDQIDCDQVEYLAGELGKAIELVRRYESIEKWEQQGVEDDLHELLNWYKFGVVEEIETLNILLLEDNLEEAKPLNDKILNRAHTAMMEIKTLHSSMKRKYLEKAKLKNALDEMVESWKALFREQDREFKIRVECDERIDLPDFVKNTLLRIAAHALTNCFKHSGMKENPNIKANICVRQHGPNVRLQVSDTGKGMERLVRGYGIKRMEQLVQKLNGKDIPSTLNFEHPVGKGTSVTVDLCLEKDQSHMSIFENYKI